MTVAQVLPIVTLYASIFCPNKQPMGSNAGRDYLERTSLETWEIKCCPQGWMFDHRRCSCIPVSEMPGYGYHPSNGVHGLKSSMGNGPGNSFFLDDLYGHVGRRTTSGADMYHTINHKTFQLVDFINDHRANHKMNSNRRNAHLLRAHRLKLKNNLRHKQLLSRRRINSDLSLNGKQLVSITHSQPNGKGKLIAVTNHGRKNNNDFLNRPSLENSQNSDFLLNRHNAAISNTIGSQTMLGNNRNTLDGMQWINGIPGNNFLVNSGANVGGTFVSAATSGTTRTSGNKHDAFTATNSHSGADGSLTNSGKNKFLNNIRADSTSGATRSIGHGGPLVKSFKEVNSGKNRGGRLTLMMGGGSVGSTSGKRFDGSNGGRPFMNPLPTNDIGLELSKVIGGDGLSGKIQIGSSNGKNLNSGSLLADQPLPDATSVAHFNLNGGSPQRGKGRNFDFNGKGTLGNQLNIDKQFEQKQNEGKTSMNSLSQSMIGIDPGLNIHGSLSSDVSLSGGKNLVDGQFGMDPFHSESGRVGEFSLKTQDPSFVPDSGFNMFDQSNTFDLSGSLTNKDTSSQNPGFDSSNGIGLDLSLMPSAEIFSSLLRNGGGLGGEVGGHFIPDNNMNPTDGQRQQPFPQLNGGLDNGLLQSSDTTQSLIDQLIALNKANNILESGMNNNGGFGDLPAINGQGSSFGMSGNKISGGITDGFSSPSFDNSIPTDPSMMNNAMLLADTRILESPTPLPSRLVTETILLNPQDQTINKDSSNQKVSIDITSGDSSVRGSLNSGLTTAKALGGGIAINGIPSGLFPEVGNMGIGETREASLGVGMTDFGVANSGIVGTGVIGGGSTAGGRINEIFPGGSKSLGLNTDVNTATAQGSTKILFDGSVRAPKQIVKTVGISSSLPSAGSTGSTLPRSETGFGLSDLQSLPQVVFQPSNEQSAIETSINQILTISAAETAIAKAAKDSNSQKKMTDSAADVGGMFVSQTALELSAISARKDNKLSPDVCLGCTMDGGLGYIRHPSRCDKFVVCYPDRSGLFKPRVQDCPYGQFWSNIDVTCKPSKDVNCENDYCKKLADNFQYSHSTNCVAYWECQAGHSVMKCCPEGKTFVKGEGCIYSSVCADRCPVSSPLQFMWQVNCNKRPVSSDVKAYEKQVSTGWISQKCPAGQIYEGEICDCIPADMGNPTYSFKGVCKPEVFLPFDTDFRDYSGSNTFIRTENVTLSNGAACFDGTSVISMPKFANMDFGKTVFMKVRYKQMDLKIDTEALLYNGDCEEVPTLVVGTKPTGNSFSVKTNTGAFQTSWVPSSVQPSDWRDVTITITNGRLEGQSGINARDLDVSGGIARSHCGIKLGWGKKFKNFVGCIDEVSIYRCIPNTSMALDGTIRT